MPFINVKTNVRIEEKQELIMKEKLGQAITTIRGKSEAWLMLNFEDNQRMYFRGENTKAMAFVEVKLYGAADGNAFEELTGKLTDIISGTLNILKSQIYIKYENTAYWGYNGHNF